MNTRFIHLRVHSAYSLAEGAIKIPHLVNLCVQNQMPAIALTDSGNLFGALEFSLACFEQGIQGIVGLQMQFKDILPQGRLARMTLLTQSEAGYKNLLKLASKAYLESHEHEPACLSWFDLKEQNEGLILLSGTLEGPVHHSLLKGQAEDARRIAGDLQALFQNRFYLEISRCGYPEEAKIETELLKIALEHHLPLVATNEVYFDRPEMHEAHDILLCISEGVTVSVEERRRISKNHYFKSQQEMVALFSDLPEALDNTVQIAKRCCFMPRATKPILPPFPTCTGRTEEEELVHQAKAGLLERLQAHGVDGLNADENVDQVKKRYFERLDYELSVITNMGFPGYFLIVSDFIRWAKSLDIPVGPGRGSGAGSLVAWALMITDIDPIAFNLLFERFLNPERVSMPDFDIDFCQDRRDEVIQYVLGKYGADKVAHIITFGKLQARAVLRDVGRVLEMPYGHVDKICKMIPHNPVSPVNLEQALKMDAQIMSMARSDPAVEKLLSNGLKLEGLYRHASTHAAGVVIGDRPLNELVPLYRDPRSALPATQFSMKYVEQAGLMKFDFLGLKTLTVISQTCRLVRETVGEEIDISTICLSDPKTFALLNKVETVGVFQLESGGMKDVLRRLKPDRFEELIALVALYRPGPMDDIPHYLARKHGQEPVRYLHPLLEPILKESFGVMVVQEQVMQIAQVMAGYTLGGADLLRRAMGKKNRDEMDAQRAKFVEGSVKNGVAESLAQAIFDQISKFAGYGFNKSHAAPYALLTYRTAYLKANYPVEFLCASMTLDMGNTDKLNLFKQELKRSGIRLLPPDVNASFADFSVEKMPDGSKAVRYGLGAIKNVGHQAMQEIVKVREKGGIFHSLADFLQRIDVKLLNKRQAEGLILAGVFDEFSSNRHAIWASLDEWIIQKKQNSPSSLNLFLDSGQQMDFMLKNVEDWSPLDRLQKEFDVLGFYFSAHPLDGYPLKQLKVVFSSDFIDGSLKKEGSFSAVGVVVNFKERVSKNGSRFAFVQMSDPFGQYEVVLFSDLLSKIRGDLNPGQAFYMKLSGRFEADQLKLSVQEMDVLDNKIADHPLELTIRQKEALIAVKAFCENLACGQVQIILHLLLDGGKVTVRLPQRYDLSLDVRSSLLKLAEKG